MSGSNLRPVAAKKKSVPKATVQYRVTVSKAEVRTSGPDDAEVIFSCALADASSDPTARKRAPIEARLATPAIALPTQQPPTEAAPPYPHLKLYVFIGFLVDVCENNMFS